MFSTPVEVSYEAVQMMEERQANTTDIETGAHPTPSPRHFTSLRVQQGA